MQRTYTFEIRVDFADHEKNDAMERIMNDVAAYALANAAMLSDHAKPQVMLCSDDSYAGHSVIEFMPNRIKEGKELLGGGEDEGVSQEMLDALRQK